MRGATYHKLLSEKQFLRVQERARALTGSRLVSIEYDDAYLIFKTESGTTPGVFWEQKLLLQDLAKHIELVNLYKKKTGRDFYSKAHSAMKANMEPLTTRNLNKALQETPIRCSCNCLAEDTRVLTSSGFKPIQLVAPGDLVLGSDNNWHVVILVKKSELKNNWKRLKIRGMVDDLIVTTDHKLLFQSYRDYCACGCGKRLRPASEAHRQKYAFSLYEKRKMIPKHTFRVIGDDFQKYQLHSLEDYKVGEVLCAPIVKGYQEFDRDYARMLGYYLAEGNIVSRNVTQITLNRNERDTIARDIEQYFSSRGVQVVIKETIRPQQSWLSVKIYDAGFRDDCIFWCGQKSKTKVPNPLCLQWNDDAKISFLIGHLLGDGAVDDSFRWLSTSRDLIDMIQLLLNSLKVHASTYVAEYERGNRSRIYATSCTINSFYNFYKEYKSLFREKDIVAMNKSNSNNNMSDYALYKITEIIDEKPQQGYDIVLADEPHTFTAGGLLVSNCPADLYWGFRYIRWRIGAGLIPEHRRPRVRNPRQQGFVCKHLFRVLTFYPEIINVVERLLIKKGLVKDKYVDENVKGSVDTDKQGS